MGRHNEIAAGKDRLSLLSSVIRAHLADLFPGRELGEFSQFRVTRHSELAVDEEDVTQPAHRAAPGPESDYGQPCGWRCRRGVRLSAGQFSCRRRWWRGPVNLVRLGQLVDLAERPSLLFPAWRAAWPQGLVQGHSILAQLRSNDVLMHHPFESFDAVLAFLREAVHDPDVLVIKQTIYRTGADSADGAAARGRAPRQGGDGRGGAEGAL